jgi:hypothetical protein
MLTSGGSDEHFHIYAASGIANGNLDFGLVDGDLTYTHNNYNTGAQTTKKIAFTDDIPKIVPLTQSEYSALPVKDETTIYIIKE